MTPDIGIRYRPESLISLHPANEPATRFLASNANHLKRITFGTERWPDKFTLAIGMDELKGFAIYAAESAGLIVC